MGGLTDNHRFNDTGYKQFQVWTENISTENKVQKKPKYNMVHYWCCIDTIIIYDTGKESVGYLIMIIIKFNQK